MLSLTCIDRQDSNAQRHVGWFNVPLSIKALSSSDICPLMRRRRSEVTPSSALGGSSMKACLLVLQVRQIDINTAQGWPC